MAALIGILHKKDRNTAETALKMLETFGYRKIKKVGIASPFAIAVEQGSTKLKARFNSDITIGYVFQEILSKDEPQPIKLDHSTLVFDGRIYRSGKQVSQRSTVSSMLENDPNKGAETLISRAKGDFCFAIAQKSALIVGRDPIGNRPFYYGQNDELIVFASNRRAIWRTGIEEAMPFPPGHVGTACTQGLEIRPVKTLAYEKPQRISLHEACAKLQALLERSVEERLSDSSSPAVAFSGGLDSGVIAQLSKKTKANITLIHASLKDQPETEHAVKAAQELELPIHVCILNEEDVKRTIIDVLMLVEEADPLKVSIGIPIYWTAKEASKKNVDVLLGGQGADELFGGYKKYDDEYRRRGVEEMTRMMLSDIARLHEINLDRDSKICKFFGVELRLPFADYEIAEFAMRLPPKYKIKRENGARKLILRQVAQRIGLPGSIANRPKKAIQYSTGVNNVLEKYSRSCGGIREFLTNELSKIRILR